MKMYNLRLNRIYWPTDNQELLLKACFLPKEQSIAAFKLWQEKIDINNIDKGSCYFLPLLYHRLCSYGISTAVTDILKINYTRTCSQNWMYFHDLMETVKQLQINGVQMLFLKGFSLIIGYYKDFGLRPITDIDLLVKKEQLMSAIEVLTKMEWHEEGNFVKFTQDYNDPHMSLWHARHFKNNKKRTNLDLHWRSLFLHHHEDVELAFWRDAKPITIYGVSVLILNPTDQLLHNCIHGMRWNPIPPIRWVADACTIINNHHAEIDWDRLYSLAQRCERILAIRNALCYLKYTLQAPVPEHVIAKFTRAHISLREKIEYKLENNRPTRIGKSIAHYLRYSRYRNQYKSTPQPKKITSFIDYLKYSWGRYTIKSLYGYISSKVKANKISK